MQKELLTLFSRLSFGTGGTPTVDPAHVNVFNMEVASLGYTFGPDLFARLREVSAKGFGKLRGEVLDLLMEVTGASKKHRVLFANFPHSMPGHHEYLLTRVLGYIQHEYNLAPANSALLSCGHAIDPRLFDLREFGACPICQSQVPELLGNATKRSNIPFERLTPLKIIGFADDAFLVEAGSRLLARNSSLSEAEKTILRSFSLKGGLTMPERVFRENLPFFYETFGLDNTIRVLSGATDALRLAAHLSSPENDLSLAKAPKFALTRQQRRHVLIMLESRDDIVEDLMRHPEVWKRFAKHVHIGADRQRSKFPNTAAAFDRLLKYPEFIETFNRTIHKHVIARQVTADFVETLAARPGEFVRRLDFLLRTAGADPHPFTATARVTDALTKVLPSVPTKLLFEVRKYLQHRSSAPANRVFIPKGMANKAQVLPDTRAPIRTEVLLAVADLIDREVQGRLAKLEPMGKVYLDPDLRRVLLPFNRRGDSNTSVPVMKGMRFKIAEAARVLRLFIHWTGEDVDLSAVTLSETFAPLDQVSYTKLSALGMGHSGDITDAPNGASEFIDIDIAKVRQKTRARYVAMSVISYRGGNFSGFPCFAGFMERDALNSGQVFEPTSVALKFDVKAAGKSAMPLIFDLVEREVVFCDLASGGRDATRVQDQGDKFQALVEMVMDQPNAKTTAYDVLSAHARARGEIVETPEAAEHVYRRDGLDMEAVMNMTT